MIITVIIMMIIISIRSLSFLGRTFYRCVTTDSLMCCNYLFINSAYCTVCRSVCNLTKCYIRRSSGRLIIIVSLIAGLYFRMTANLLSHSLQHNEPGKRCIFSTV
jgi:hypothetical protein